MSAPVRLAAAVANGFGHGSTELAAGSQPWEGEAPAEPNAHGTAAQQELRPPKTPLSDRAYSSCLAVMASLRTNGTNAYP